jgi:Domain of unknown function (DUF4347)
MGRLTQQLLNSAAKWRSFGQAGRAVGRPSRSMAGHGYFMLEPRVMFDAAAAEHLIEHVVRDTTHHDGGPDRDASQLLDALRDTAPVAEMALPAHTSNEIVFVDSAVEDIDVLIAGFGPQVEVHILDADKDGVGQIADILDGRSGLDAIHIFSHGRSGTLDLGSAKLTAASIAGKHADEMAIIQRSLSSNADILLPHWPMQRVLTWQRRRI